MKKKKFSVGICAYNEEENIGRLLKVISKQRIPESFLLDEIIVISSGSIDKTNEIVREMQKKDGRIKLIVQKERRGKVAAINLFLKKTKNQYLILESADTLPDKDTYFKMLSILSKKDVGMVGARIVPLNDPKTLMGFCAHFLWSLHHRINLQFPERPKIGEIVVFKKIFRRIPSTAIVDEASIEPLIHGQGYKVVYCPEAVVYNKGPETIRDYLRQRRRNYAGHTAIRYRYGYTVVTYSNFRILGVLIANIDWSNWQFFVYTPLIVVLEAIARFVGLMDFKLKLRDHRAWKIAKSTKKLK